MIKISNIKLKPNYDTVEIENKICKILKISPSQLKSFSLIKRSLDARKTDNIVYNVSVKVKVTGNENKIINKAKSNNVSIYKDKKYEFISINKNFEKTVVVGSGPAGLFAAYLLVKSNLKPIIIERGQKIEDRIKSVDDFCAKGILNEESNIQFGEGGAGTFSDGKLNTGISDERIRLVLETFYQFGAPKEILYDNKPHIGTDILRKVIINFRKFIEDNGGEFRFSTKFVDYETDNNKVSAAIVESNGIYERIECDNIILAVGHSARDTFSILYNKGLEMQQKAFAIGARIEHTQEFINKLQYKNEYNNKYLPVADYKTAVHLDNGRSVFSFCMCPGGYVVPAASEINTVVVNGMSNYKRDGVNANSALLVNVTPEDFATTHPLAGIEFQRKIEKKAFEISSSYKAPAQTVGSFIKGIDNTIKTVVPTYKPDVCLCNLTDVLPEFICTSLKEGIIKIDKKLKGFADDDAIITAPETRSSSPVRILRNNNYSCKISGIYPCGEGAGYAGGITSAAVDGIKVAEAVISKLI